MVYKSLKKELKNNVRKRFHNICQGCGRKFKASEKEQLEVHHVKTPIQGEHLVPLCHSCHLRIERRR